MPHADCPGPDCNRDNREPNLGDPIWCDWCMGRIRDALDDFSRQCSFLRADDLYGTGRPSADIITGTRERRTPAPGDDLADEIERGLAAWSEAVQAIAGRWIGAAEAIRTMPEATRWGLEVLIVYGEVTARTATGPDEVRDPEPCPGCGHQALRRHKVTQRARCVYCKKEWRGGRYDPARRTA